jgi:Heterokaryon incompatibility protein (HET)
MDHKGGITWDKLPRTFQDAISFTRRLKIRYLWIDSLYIFQDDNKDWQRQASRMPSIYENSYVTLAAMASDSSNGVCFYKADPGYKAK